MAYHGQTAIFCSDCMDGSPRTVSGGKRMLEIVIGFETAILIAVICACTSNICDRLDVLIQELREDQEESV